MKLISSEWQGRKKIVIAKWPSLTKWWWLVHSSQSNAVLVEERPSHPSVTRGSFWMSSSWDNLRRLPWLVQDSWKLTCRKVEVLALESKKQWNAHPDHWSRCVSPSRLVQLLDIVSQYCHLQSSHKIMFFFHNALNTSRVYNFMLGCFHSSPWPYAVRRSPWAIGWACM